MIYRLQLSASIIFLTFVLLLTACDDTSTGPDDGFHLPAPAFPSPYEEPSWSADGKTIVFRREKVLTVDSRGAYPIDPDSTGIWSINPDGTDMHLLMKKGFSPALSPDGEWLAFMDGAQIHKVRYVNGEIDTTSFVQLTTEGRNFFPAWSPDGEWIAYDNTNCGSTSEPAPPNSCGILVIRPDGSESRFITRGRMPAWDPSKVGILYKTRAITNDGFVFGDSLWIFNLETKMKRFLILLKDENYDNRDFVYSMDGSKIAFSSWDNKGSGAQIWSIDLASLAVEQISKVGWSSDPSPSPDGRIVFVHFVSANFDDRNGTLWIMDADGSDMHQLTYNHGITYLN